MTNLTASIAELKTLVSQAETELLSLQSGKKASAPRVRASLQKIKTLSHSMRADVMEHVKALPTKAKPKKAVEEEEENIPPPPKLERETSEAVPVKKPRQPRKKASKKKTAE